MWCEEFSGDFEPASIEGAEEARVAHLGEAVGKHVGEEAGDELLGRERGGLPLATSVVAEVEADRAVVVETIEAAVGDGDAEEVATEVVEDFFAAARVLANEDRGRA